MQECPHLVIDAHGMCEWCLQTIAFPDSRPQETSKSNAVPEPSAELLKARWAARFGTDEDYRNAMEELARSIKKLG